jgi:cytochrome c peroxidase
VRVDAGFVKTMLGREPSDAAPAESPSTPEKVALGKALFHDKALSKDGSVSCATCHDLGNYGVDGKVLSAGAGGVAATRNTPTLWNAARQFRQFWDGRGASIEKGLAAHATEASVFGVDEAGLVGKVKANAEHAAAFAKAFPGGESVTAANLEHALGAFLRTLVTKSRFDAYLDGDAKALTGDELYGLKAFLEKGCLTCHLGRLAGGHAYQKTGVQKPYASKDEGRALLTKSDADKFFFKVPSLLNVEKTAPYLHDGKVKTLEETVRLMADIQLGAKLTDDEVRGIVAFLKSLTGTLPADVAPPSGGK